MGMTGRECVRYHVYSLWPYLLGEGEAAESRKRGEVRKVVIWGRRLGGGGIARSVGCCGVAVEPGYLVLYSLPWNKTRDLHCCNITNEA